MNQMTTLLAQPLGLSAIWQRVLLEANPQAGDTAALDAQGLTLVFPEGYDPASTYHRISVYATSLDVPDMVMPGADAAILVPADALTLRGQETIFSGTGDGLTPLCQGRLPAELDILEPSIFFLREVYATGTKKDVEHGSIRLLTALGDVLARNLDLDPVAWGWIYALSEAVVMVAMERGFAMKPDFFAVHSAFAALAAPTIRFQ